MRRAVRTTKATTPNPSVSTEPIMNRIDQKKPDAGSAPPFSLVAATAALQFGQAKACDGSSQRRARAVGRRVRIRMGERGAYCAVRAGAK